MHRVCGCTPLNDGGGMMFSNRLCFAPPRSTESARLLLTWRAIPQKEKNEHPCQKRTGVKEGKRKTKHKKHNKGSLVPSTHRCISDFESWTGWLTCGVMVMAPAYIYILTGDAPRHVAHTCMDLLIPYRVTSLFGFILRSARVTGACYGASCCRRGGERGGERPDHSVY